MVKPCEIYIYYRFFYLKVLTETIYCKLLSFGPSIYCTSHSGWKFFQFSSINLQRVWKKKSLRISEMCFFRPGCSSCGFIKSNRLRRAIKSAREMIFSCQTTINIASYHVYRNGFILGPIDGTGYTVATVWACFGYGNIISLLIDVERFLGNSDLECV